MVRNRQGRISSLNGVLSGDANLVSRLGGNADVHGDRVSLVSNLLVLHVVLVTSLVLRGSRVARTRRQGKAAELTHNGVHVVNAMVDLMTMGRRAVMLSTANFGCEVALIVSLAVVASVVDDTGVGAIMGRHL